MPRWFRHYAGLSRDEKLMAAALASDQSIQLVVWLWCAILEDAAERNDAGAFVIDLPAAAWLLHCDVAALVAIMEALTRAGRIDGGRVMNWPARQFASDQSAPRVAAYRERQRAAVTETLPKRFRNAPESESESEKEEKKNGHVTLHARPDTNPKELVEMWNELAAKIGKPQARNLTPTRRDLLKARIGQYSLDDFATVFVKIEQSKFLRDWPAFGFDWVFKAANFQKILEGNYDR